MNKPAVRILAVVLIAVSLSSCGSPDGPKQNRLQTDNSTVGTGQPTTAQVTSSSDASNSRQVKTTTSDEVSIREHATTIGAATPTPKSSNTSDSNAAKSSNIPTNSAAATSEKSTLVDPAAAAKSAQQTVSARISASAGSEGSSVKLPAAPQQSSSKLPIKPAPLPPLKTETNNLLQQANKFYSRGEYRSAVAKLDELIKLDSANLAALRMRARAQLVDQPSLAVADLNKIITLKPTSNDYSDLAFANCCLGEFAKGREAALHAIQIDPKNAEAHHNLAWCYNGLKQFENAIAEENKAMQMNMKEAWNYNNRAWAYKDLNKFKEALADFETALKKKPDYMQAYLGRSQLYAKMAERDKESAKQFGYSE